MSEVFAAEPLTDPALREAAALRRGRARLGLVACVILAAYGVVAWRMAEIAQRADGEARRIAALAADRARADIIDRNGEVMATNIDARSIMIDPSMVDDPAEAARKLADALPGVDRARLEARLKRPPSPRFAWVERMVTPAEAEAAFRTGVPGLYERFEERRIYPNTDMAAAMLGFVDIDNRGLQGLELAFDEALSGGEGLGKPPLRSSIDLRVQHAVRDELETAMRRFEATGANAIVMDVETGEILSWTSLPTYDANAPFDGPSAQRRDRNLRDRYEHGSVFKIFTFAAALEEGVMTIEDVFEAPRRRYIGRVGIGDLHPIGRPATVPEIFKESSNTGTTNISLELGAERQRAFLERLGMFERAPIDLPSPRCPQLPVDTGSQTCRQQALERWGEIYTATVGFGHGISVTPLHVARAVAGVVNGGLMPEPTVIKRRPGERAPSTRIVSEKVSEELRFLMWLVVADGTATQAASNSYLVGGKTGTAEMPTDGGYARNDVLSSFVGVFPIEDPKYLVLASLERPQGDEGTHGFRSAGWTIAPYVGRMIDRIGPILGVRPSASRARRAFEDRIVPISIYNPKRNEMEESVAARPLDG